MQLNDLFLLGDWNETQSKLEAALLPSENNSNDSSDDPLANEDIHIKLQDEESDSVEIKSEFTHNLPYRIVPASNASRKTSICEQTEPQYLIRKTSKSVYNSKSTKTRRLSANYSCDPSERHFMDKTSLDKNLNRNVHDTINENDKFSDSSLMLTENSLPVSSTIQNFQRVSEVSVRTHQSPRCMSSDCSSDEMQWSQVHQRCKKKIRKLRSYFCDQCGRHFNDKANLNRHLQRHLGVKKFECQECGHKDYSQHLINLHTRIQHHGEKPYACKYCGNRFANSMARLRHQRSLMVQNSCKIS